MSESKACGTWEFTLNNYTDEDLEIFTRWSKDCKGMWISKEVAPETGTPHLQGRVIWSAAKRFAAVKKLHGECHWEPSKQVKDHTYIFKKGSEVFIDIDNRKQGRRTDLEECCKQLETRPFKEVMREYPTLHVRYGKGLRDHKALFEEECGYEKFDELRWPLENLEATSLIAWGASGIGKTVWACAHFKNPLLVSSMDDLGKFDSAEHDGIVFDDMDFTDLSRTTQIHLLDWTTSRTIKIRYVNAWIPRHTKKIFTTNEPEGRIFTVGDAAIDRRMTVKEIVSEDGYEADVSEGSVNEVV